MKCSGIALALSMLLFASCQKDKDLQQPAGEIDARSGNGHYKHAGHVFTESNDASGNEVLMYKRSADGLLTFEGSFPTGGNGTSGPLGNQGGVILARDGSILLAVNAGSNSISSFKVSNNNLTLKSTVYSGGTRPVSITSHGDLVYVLNQGGNGNISGFRLTSSGKLEPIPNSTRPLSVAAPTDPAQVSFVLGGRVLVITEKATNTITTYTVNQWGVPDVKHTIMSSTPTPFGFAPGQLGNIFVSEAAGGAPGASVLSSYRVNYNGEINVVEGSVGAGQTAACWVVIAYNMYAYTTNTGSNNITNFGVNVASGDINVLYPVAATTPAGPIDAALSENSEFMYVLNSMDHSISVFRVNANGTLTNLQTVTGLPPAANGLAAK